MSEGLNDFVIHGRSKERSDAAQTPGAAPQPKGSMPGLLSATTGAEFCSAAFFDQDHGMDPRVSATELRFCFAQG
ncbi:Uncharacterized protein MLTONO_4644 [Mesorhizobium loti]|nr:Uncharacterized protein MLTONO_4644 [Mesorhizobium loti]